jgi:hypothetical protein
MLLNEFFGKAQGLNGTDKHKFKEEQLMDDVFEYILNQDDLHKKYFLPAAKKIKIEKSKEHDPQVWLPLVNHGCMKFYKERELIDDPKDLFNKEVRKKLCQRFAKHFHEDIIKDEYKVM